MINNISYITDMIWPNSKDRFLRSTKTTTAPLKPTGATTKITATRTTIKKTIYQRLLTQLWLNFKDRFLGSIMTITTTSTTISTTVSYLLLTQIWLNFKGMFNGFTSTKTIYQLLLTTFLSINNNFKTTKHLYWVWTKCSSGIPFIPKSTNMKF